MAQQNFLGDPMFDRIMLIVVNLAEELYVTRYRMQIMERLLDSRGVLKTNEIERFSPDSAAAVELKKARDEFVARLLESAVNAKDSA